jgi:hypothetical protein
LMMISEAKQAVKMSSHFPQLCKWTGITIDSPSPQCDYGPEVVTGKLLPLHW